MSAGAAPVHDPEVIGDVSDATPLVDVGKTRLPGLLLMLAAVMAVALSVAASIRVVTRGASEAIEAGRVEGIARQIETLARASATDPTAAVDLSIHLERLDASVPVLVEAGSESLADQVQALLDQAAGSESGAGTMSLVAENAGALAVAAFTASNVAADGVRSISLIAGVMLPVAAFLVVFAVPGSMALYLRRRERRRGRMEAELIERLRSRSEEAPTEVVEPRTPSPEPFRRGLQAIADYIEMLLIEGLEYPEYGRALVMNVAREATTLQRHVEEFDVVDVVEMAEPGATVPAPASR